MHLACSVSLTASKYIYDNSSQFQRPAKSFGTVGIPCVGMVHSSDLRVDFSIRSVLADPVMVPTHE